MSESARSVFAVSHSACVLTGSRPALPHEPDVTNEYESEAEQQAEGVAASKERGGCWWRRRRWRWYHSLASREAAMVAAAKVAKAEDGSTCRGSCTIRRATGRACGERIERERAVAERAEGRIPARDGCRRRRVAQCQIGGGSHSARPTTWSKPALVHVPDVTRTYGVGGDGGGGDGGGDGGEGGGGGAGGRGGEAVVAGPSRVGEAATTVAAVRVVEALADARVECCS